MIEEQPVRKRKEIRGRETEEYTQEEERGKKKWRKKIPTACYLDTVLLTAKFQNVSSVT